MGPEANIRGDERGNCLGPSFFRDAVGLLWEFRIYFLHCFGKKLMNHFKATI